MGFNAKTVIRLKAIGDGSGDGCGRGKKLYREEAWR